MWWMIGYLIGVIIAYIIIAIRNDKYFYGKMTGLWVITSWCVPLSFVLGFVIGFIVDINFYPTLNWRERKND